MTHQHKEVHLHFMLPDHTKFAPGWCFGLLEKKFRVLNVSSLNKLSNCVKASTKYGINIPQLVGDERGNVFVPTYDWHEYFKGCGSPFNGIKSLQHFSLTAAKPGVCVGTVERGGPADTKIILTSLPSIPFPTEIAPPGLSRERRNYLFRNIRQFVKPGLEDIMCPKL